VQVSKEWLSEWVASGWDTPTLAARLTMAGFEVEAVTSAAPAFTGVVVGEVLSVGPHPRAERLQLAVVDSGTEQLQVVCGAKNVAPGLKAPLALAGAVLPDGKTIGRTEVRGVASAGMLCSARELGLGEAPEGLLELPPESRAGMALREALNLDDAILSINFTPNRGDALSLLGLAREVAVLADAALKGPALGPVRAGSDARFPVRLLAPEAAPRFVGRVLHGLDRTMPTPLWMRERLRRAGLRSLGPLIDVTNYVMLELGQPLHAYDLGQLHGDIEVRFATAGEQLMLLDGSSITLAPDLLVIADAKGPIGLAGIMGGERSAVAASTTDILLESAWFAPSALTGRARRLGVLTEASQRFERGVDPTGQERAIERASALLLSIAGGTAGPTQLTEAPGQRVAAPAIRLRRAVLDRLIGFAIPAARVESILRALGLTVKRTAEGYESRPPPWRFDLAIEADLVEEVARVYGYNEIPPVDAPIPQCPGTVPEGVVSDARQAIELVDRGYSEAITYSFVDGALQRRLFPEERALALTNPIAADLSEMRVSLWPGLLGALQTNVRRQQPRVRLFEHGVKFVQRSEQLAEIPCLAGLAWGLAETEQWGRPSTACDFYDVKSDAEALLALTGAAHEFRFAADSLGCLHPGRTARIYRGDRACGWLGELHPRLCRELELAPAPLLFEFETDISNIAQLPVGKEVSKFPSLRRDLAVVVDEAVTFSELRESATVAAASLLRELTVFDVYRGPGIETGRKSVALGLILQGTSRTLTDADADAVVTAVAEQLRRDWNAVLRA
jgi:phenylalanyl-tRNA synthetase beta chain